jgi:ribA/ribD-fused uncharacterized protein
MTSLIDIKGFSGPERWLSNFYPCKIKYMGLVYPSSEHAYQAAKSTDPSIRKLFTQIKSPASAKRLGQTIEKDQAWDESKEGVMLDILRIKFSQDPLKRWLEATGDVLLEETNTWGDVFWGVCNDQGENKLGKILMQIRTENRVNQTGE